MYFETFADFLAMGRHGLYVWLSYGIFLAIILWNIWLVVSSRREALTLTKQAWRRADAETDRFDVNSGGSSTDAARAHEKQQRVDLDKDEEAVSQ